MPIYKQIDFKPKKPRQQPRQLNHLITMRAKILKKSEREDSIFPVVLRVLMPRNNGTKAGVEALRKSLDRSNPNQKMNDVLNVLCLPDKATAVNTFRDENSFERLSEQFHVVHKIEGEVCHA